MADHDARLERLLELLSEAPGADAAGASDERIRTLLADDPELAADLPAWTRLLADVRAGFDRAPAALRARLRDLRDRLPEPRRAPSWIESLERVVASLVRRDDELALGLRGAGSSLLAFEAGTIAIDIEVSVDPDDSAAIIVHGQLDELDGDRGGRPVAVVDPDGGSLAETSTDARGRFAVRAPVALADAVIVGRDDLAIHCSIAKPA